MSENHLGDKNFTNDEKIHPKIFSYSRDVPSF